MPVPLNRLFDYSLPAGISAPEPGSRVIVPFANRKRTGWVESSPAHTAVAPDRLLDIERVVDQASLIPTPIWQLLQWCWRYYHHPPGEVISVALPPGLRTGRPLPDLRPRSYFLNPAAELPDLVKLQSRAPRQREILEFLSAGPKTLTQMASLADGWRVVLKKLVEKDWVTVETDVLPSTEAKPGPSLNSDQRAAVAALEGGHDGFKRFLLDGVTGSGKTEVYLQLISKMIARDRQVLVLVPEIGLTPQLVNRFRRRLGIEPVIAHSGLSEGERLQTWSIARQGSAPVIIGTRSAVFIPLARPGLIILDEEHDLSFKQQDRFRYSARDVAVKRARLENIPVILGSATPALESLNNALAGRYSHIQLHKRATGGVLPQWKTIDLKQQSLQEGISQIALHDLEQCLNNGEQALVFLNRRGYAPVLLCHECGWQGDCPRCDSHLTLHRGAAQLLCHRCDFKRPLPDRCPACMALDLRGVGEGTERVADFLTQHFNGYPVIRIDRDSTRRKGAMAKLLEPVKDGRPCILVGTQMLAKGHHFPGLSLAIILNADQSLYSSDFRAMERFAQLLTQVAGRTGRGQTAGLVLVQTYHPDQPQLVRLMNNGYPELARQMLAERQAAELPPFSFHAMLRAESANQQALGSFLRVARKMHDNNNQLSIFGPMPALQARRAGRYREQLLLQSKNRRTLHRFLDGWLNSLASVETSSQVRWIVDVDPQEF